MKKIFFIMILAVCLLSLSSIFTSCDNEDTFNDDYELRWMVIKQPWTIDSLVSNFSWDVQLSGIGGSRYAFGAKAEIILGDCYSNPDIVLDSDYKKGSYKELLNYKKDGISAPNELKENIRYQGDGTVPLAGIFLGSLTYPIVFYIDKIHFTDGN